MRTRKFSCVVSNYKQKGVPCIKVESNNGKGIKEIIAQIKEAYKEYIGEPGGHMAHQLLHTSYAPREKYNLSQE